MAEIVHFVLRGMLAEQKQAQKRGRGKSYPHVFHDQNGLVWGHRQVGEKLRQCFIYSSTFCSVTQFQEDNPANTVMVFPLVCPSLVHNNALSIITMLYL